MSGTRIKVIHSAVGPSHDPYGRTTLRVWRLGHYFEFVMCSLAGDTYSKDDCIIVENSWNGLASEAFAEDAGARPDQFVHWYESRIYVEDPMGSLSYYI